LVRRHQVPLFNCINPARVRLHNEIGSTEVLVKRLRDQNPIILALAIIGVGAILYFLWQGYQQHLADQQARQFLGTAPSGAASQLYQPSKKPPPQ
jgi:hypothetical protein